MSALLNSVLDALLPKGGQVLVFYNAYIDESGCDDYSSVLTVGGYIVEANAARAMEAEWEAALKRYNLPYFHMVDCAHGSEAFKGLSSAIRTQMQSRFMTIIEKYVQYGLSVVIPIKSNNPDYAGILADPLYPWPMDVHKIYGVGDDRQRSWRK